MLGDLPFLVKWRRRNVRMLLRRSAIAHRKSCVVIFVREFSRFRSPGKEIYVVECLFEFTNYGGDAQNFTGREDHVVADVHSKGSACNFTLQDGTMCATFTPNRPNGGEYVARATQKFARRAYGVTSKSGGFSWALRRSTENRMRSRTEGQLGTERREV
jgi:hypothetical protein